jgi:hypothetical protein
VAVDVELMWAMWRESMTRRLIPAFCVMLMVASSNGGQASAEPQSSGEPQASATIWRLASAQVVTSTAGPPTLKLTASGPIAFETLPVDANGDPVGPDRVVARLFGVAPGDVATFGGLAPFGLTVTAAESANGTDTDTIVTITTGAVSTTSGQKLVLRAGMKSHEIEAALVSAH